MMDSKKFIIVGERRSGTSTLAKWIESHPELYLYPKVDQAFFLDDELRGRREWLEGHVDIEAWDATHQMQQYEALFLNRQPGCSLVGEKSADYFFWKPCLDRIQFHLPKARIVVILRHPVERAWSHYWNEVGKGRENLSFEEAIEAEPERAATSDYARLHLSYVERGKYIQSLSRWRSVYGHEQLHVVVLESLIADPVTELQQLYRFLGVNPQLGLELAGKRFNHNWTTMPREFWKSSPLTRKLEEKLNWVAKRITRALFRDPYSRRKYGPKLEMLTRVPPNKIEMPIGIREYLLELYRPFNSQLQELEGFDLSGWGR